MTVCEKNHRYAEIFKELSPDQGDDGRHKCAGCAYELGFTDGLNNRLANYQGQVASLLDSQAGTVRHKDPEEAYNLGYKEGQKKYNEQ